jgi:HK97 family phage prohead protease
MSAIGRKQFVSTILSSPESAPDEPTMTISTAAPDRDGDRVIPEGGDLAAYRRNPVVCWSHLYSELPIGACTGLDVLPREGLRMHFRWLASDPFAERVRNAWDQGIIRAASIGFLSHRSTRNPYGGLDHLEWELVEVSLVPVPANAEAVRTLHALKLFSLAGAGSRHEADDPDTISRLLREALTSMPEDEDEIVSLDGVLQDLHATEALRQEFREAVHLAMRQLITDTLEPLTREARMRHTGRVD